MRDRDSMTRTAHAHVRGVRHAGAQPLDIADALDLLATAVDGRSRHAVDVRHRRYAGNDRVHSIVDRALLDADVPFSELNRMRGHRLRDLYRHAELPINLSLGALIVLDAAQQSEACGSRGDDVLDTAIAAAAKFLDLVSLMPADLASSEPPSDTPSQNNLGGAVVGH